MAALSDTPTPLQAMLAVPPQVSIKLEQGVLHEERDYGNAGAGLRNHHEGIVQDESSRPLDTHDRINEIAIGVQIKNEPALDIDDSCAIVNCSNGATNTTILPPSAKLLPFANSPIIRITPMTKLMPTPNAANPKRRYECPYENCIKSYGKSSHLRSHLTWHTGIKPFVCKDPTCGKGFTRSDELNRHVRTHTGEKPFECAQCTKKFSRSDHLTKHLVTHSKQMGGIILQPTLSKRVKQENGSKMSTTPTNIPKAPSSPVNYPVQYNDGINFMPRFISNPKPEPIDECIEKNVEVCTEKPKTPENFAKESETIKTFEGNQVHIKEESVDYNVEQSNYQQRPMVSINMTVVKSESLYCPPFAPVSRYEEDDDRNSKNAKAREEPDDDAIMPEANLPPLPLAVIAAAKKMQAANAISLLPLAIKEASGAVGVPTQDIKYNMSPMYDASRPFACNQCSKKFKRPDDLNRHIRTHTGVKPFACNECEKRFMRSDHLKKHLNTHTRIR